MTLVGWQKTKVCHLDLIRVELLNSRKYSLKLKNLSSGWLLAESCYI